jgi:ActR/RegA family two-component response regulator
MAKSARFGDFALLDDLGASDVADCFRAMHDAQGGPFLVKAYRRLPAPFVVDLQVRAERLIAVRDARLLAHLGHGLVDGVPFTVSPWVEGFDLEELGRSLRERRVTLPIEALLHILREVAFAVDALHTQTARDPIGAPLPHGEVTPRHVRVTTQGAVLLTGLVTPRGPQPGVIVDAGLDAAGIGATVYDLIAMTRPGGVRLALPQPLERLVRRALGIGPLSNRLTPREIAEAVVDVADALRVDLTTAALPELAARTMKALGRRGRSLSTTGAADSLPVLEPIADRDEHEFAALPKSRGAPELVPLDVSLTPPRAQPRPVDPPSRPTPAAPRAVPAEISTKMPPAVADTPRAIPPEATPPLRVPPKTPNPELPPPLRAPPKTPNPEPPPTLRAPPRTPAPEPSPTPRAPPKTPPPENAPPLRAPPKTPPPVAVSSSSLRPSAEAPSSTGTAPVVAQPPPRAAPPPVAPAQAPVVARPIAATAPAPITALTTAPIGLIGLAPISNDEELWATTEPPYAADGTSPLQEPTVEGPLDFDGPFELFSTSDRTAPELTALPSGDERLGLRDLDDRTRQDPLPPISTTGEQRAVTALSLDDPTGKSRAPRLADLPHDDKTRDGPPASPMTVSELSSEPLPEERPLVPAEAAVRALLERGSITRSAVQRALDQQRQRGGRLVDILIGDGAISDKDAADALADEAVKPRISDDALQRRLPPPELMQRLPQSFATEHRVLPLRLDAGVLVLAVVDPFDEAVTAEVGRIFAAKSVHVHVATRAAMTRAVLVAYRRGVAAAVETPLLLLCVDDDALAGRLGARLVNEGFRVELVATIALARRMLSSHPLDACLVTGTLTDGPGTDFLIDARADERTQELPIFLFGPDDAALEARALDLGGDDYFAMPLNMDVVVRKVRRALAKRPAKKPVPSIAEVASSVLSPFGEGAIPGEFSAPGAGDSFGSVIDDSPAEPTGVMGTLKQMSVAEIVQSLELGRKTARVELVPNEGPKGTFAFDGGQIVFATRDDGLEGEKAFYALAKHQEGFFRIHYGDQGPRRNIDKPTTFLLLEAMRLMDEDGRPEGSFS